MPAPVNLDLRISVLDLPRAADQIRVPKIAALALLAGGNQRHPLSTVITESSRADLKLWRGARPPTVALAHYAPGRAAYFDMV